MKTVATASWIHEADRMRMQLEAHGIEAMIPDEGMATANPLLGTAIGGIRVQVQDADYEEAMQLLADFQVPSVQGDLICPHCGSDRVSYEQISRKVLFISLLAIGLPLLWLKRRYTCDACGARWKQPATSSP